MEKMNSIIPKPLKVEYGKSQSTFIEQIKIYKSHEFNRSCDFLRELLNKATKFIVDFSETAEDANVLFSFNEKITDEGYNLTVSDNKIIIEAMSDKGAFYGVQSLRQLLKLDLQKNLAEIKVSDVKIIDEPRFKWRSFMLDEARHFFGMDTVKETLNMMALLKMNVFHWHLSDDQGFRVQIDKYPLLTEKGSIRNSTALNLKGYNMHKEPREMKEYGRGCFYTKDQIREIVDYAKNLFIDIVPEIDMPGHLVSAIACYPELSCSGEKTEVGNRWGVMANIGCCGKDNIYTFAKDIIDEITELFPFPYFHIGGDEVPKKNWEKCPKCQNKIKELGLKNENELQGYFNNEMLQHLNKKGIHMIGWNEILEATKLSDDTIIQWWTNGKGRELEWMKKGNKVILSKVEYVYFDHLYSGKPLSKTYSFDINSLNIPSELEDNVLGIEAPQWTEYVRDKAKFDLNTYPRLQAIAEVGWTSKSGRNFNDFVSRLDYHLDVMAKMNIGFAKKNVFEPTGLNKITRFTFNWINWVNRPNYELTLNK